MDNLSIRRVQYPACEGCLVHDGFYAAEQACILTVVEEVRKLKRRFPAYTVVVTGHSLGAAT